MSTQETDSQKTLTFDNDHLHVTLTRKPFCRVILEIQVNPEAVAAAKGKALKNITKKISVPGFRKGKAPGRFVEDKYADVIQKEWKDLVVELGFREATALVSLQPLRDGLLKPPVVHQFDEKEGARFTLEYETAPTIPSIDLDNLIFETSPETEVTDIDRANALENAVLQLATFDLVEDRGVQDEDFVDISLTLSENPPREVIKNQRGRMTETGLPSWLREKIRGLRTGESAEGMTSQDPRLGDPNPEFQSSPYVVTVNAIRVGHLPEVNDEFAKKLGLQTVEELRLKINERLENEATESHTSRRIAELQNYLVSAYPIDFPLSYLRQEKEARLDHFFKQNPKFDRRNMKQLEREVEERLLYDFTIYFLFKKLAEEQRIEIASPDITEELTRQLTLMASGRSSLDLSGDQNRTREQLENLAYDRKIKQFLLDRVKSPDR